MFKSITGGAVVSYGPVLPSLGTVPDGSLFYLTSGTPGLYVLSTSSDTSPGTLGQQPGLAWTQAININGSDYVARAGDTMTGPLDINAALTADSLAVGGAATVGTTLGVTGASTLAALTATGTTNLSGTTITVGGGASTVTVNGSINLTDANVNIGPATAIVNGDVGLTFSYNRGAGAVSAFFGYDNSADQLTFMRGISIGAGNVISGTTAKFNLSANVLSDISNVATTAPVSGQYLRWNGTAWAPFTLPTFVDQSFSQLAVDAAFTVAGVDQFITTSGETGLNFAINDTSSTTAPKLALDDTTKTLTFNLPAYSFLTYAPVANTASALISLSKGSGEAARMTLNTLSSEGLYFQIYDDGSSAGNGIRIRVDATQMASHLSTAIGSSYLTTGATGQTKTGALTINGTLTATTILDVTGTTDATTYDGESGAVRTEGGASIVKSVRVGGTVYAMGDVISSASDVRLKTTIRPITSAISKVKQLTGVTYEWDNQARRAAGLGAKHGTEVGLLAQEVQAVLPEAVAPAPGADDFLTVRYERLVALLVQAVKEQQVQIDELKSQLAGR